MPILGGSGGGGGGISGSGTSGRIAKFTGASSIGNTLISVSGTNGGTLTLYDDTPSTGVSNFTVRAGAGQTGGGAGDTLFGINDGSGGGLGRFQYVPGGGRFQMVKGPSGYGSFAVVTDSNFNSYRWYVDGYNAFERFPSDGSVLWSSTTDASGTPDTGVARASAGLLQITDGGSGKADLLLGSISFQGTSASFPMLANSGTELQVKLADDSDMAILSAGLFYNGIGGAYGTWEYNRMTILRDEGQFVLGGSQDLGLGRQDAAVGVITNGSNGIGALAYSRVVQAKTTDFDPVAANCNYVFTNEGTTAKRDFTLPTAVTGYSYTFVVQDSDGLRVVADTGNTIRIGSSVSASGGNIDSTTIGSTVTLVAINSTQWFAISTNGSWTVT